MTSRFKQSGWLRRAVCALLIASLSACSTLQPVTTPREFIPAARPDRIWVTTNDNAKLLVEAPRLLGDTLVGFVGGRYEEILLPDTRWVGVRQSAPRRTAFLVAGVVVLGASLAYLLMSNGAGGGAPASEDPSVPGGLLYPRGLR